MALSCYMIWLAWLSRNQTIFQGFDFTPPHVAHITRSACNKNRPSSKENPVKELKESEKPDFEQGWGILMGACRGVRGMCGDGAILYPNQQHIINQSLQWGQALLKTSKT